MNNIDNRLTNKWWRLNNLYKIKNKQGELVTFQPNIMQLRHLAERSDHSRNLITKSRQFGFTTLYCIDYLDEALWTPGINCAILGHEREALDRIFDIIKLAYTELPKELKAITKTDTKRAYNFVSDFMGRPLNSQIYVALKVRSGTVHNLHITESAFIKDRQELNAGSKQAVPKEGRISEETTGNGFNDYYDFYTTQSALPNPGPYDYKTYFYAWYENPEYSLPGELPEITQSDIIRYGKEKEIQLKYSLTDGQMLWRRWKINELSTKGKEKGTGLSGIQLFMQEYPSSIKEAFQSGLGSVFDPLIMEYYEAVRPPYFHELEATARIGYDQKSDTEKRYIDLKLIEAKKLIDKGVSIWELPKMGREYVIGVDPSDGDGSDFGPIDVWDKVEISQVAQEYLKLRPDLLAEHAAELGMFYNEAFIGVENNQLSTILFLSKIYENYYSYVQIEEKTEKRTRKLGWNTNTKTRDVMIDDFIILFEERNLIIRSAITLSEMTTFIKKDSGKREHADGKHDDTLFAGFIAIQMRKFERPRARVFANSAF